MSTSLYWEPVRPERKLRSLTDQLKYIFGPRYWGHDGTCHGEEVFLDHRSISYLTGLIDATHDKEVKRDAQVLIDAIQKYGSVKIWLES